MQTWYNNANYKYFLNCNALLILEPMIIDLLHILSYYHETFFLNRHIFKENITKLRRKLWSIIIFSDGFERTVFTIITV
jgi:hypothetical protein